jgi:Flp pilus assembly protein TadG
VRGAEMVEFAVVVVLLIMLLYGIISYGLILAAQSTITQAAADAARSGMVMGSSTTTCGSVANVPSADCTAVAQASTDIGWMNKGCVETVTIGGTTSTVSGSGPITCNALEEVCPSNANATCLKVTVSYNYSTAPLFPELPGMGIFMPSTISSTNILQMP